MKGRDKEWDGCAGGGRREQMRNGEGEYRLRVQLGKLEFKNLKN